MCNKCQKCGENDGLELHACPYEEEICENYDEYCNCCDACISECLDEI